MTFWEGVFFVACLVLVAVPPYFVAHRVYKDGLLGRLALLGISFFGLLVVMETIFGKGYGIDKEVALLVASFALFLIWHLVRFHRRVARPAAAAAEHIGPIGLR